MKNRLLLALAFLIFASASAQEEVKLSLQDAQEYALGHNRTLKNASLDIQKSEASRWQSIAGMLPQVSASVEYANMLGHTIDFSGMTIAMPANATIGGNASVAFSAAQLINVKLSDIAVKMADITRQQTEQQTTSQVKSIYYSVLVMEKTLGLLGKNLENLNKLMVQTEQSVKVGVAEQTDADQISVQVATMKTSINANQRSLEMLYNSLRLQLGIGIDAKITLTQTLDDLMNLGKTASLLGEDLILDNNYNYQLLKENVKLSEKQVQIAKWNYAPTISAYYNYTNIQYFSDESTFNMTPPHVVGFTLNVPIFSSGKRKEALNEAKLGYQQELNTLEDTQESLLVQHKQLSYNLKSAYESYETQEKNIEVTQRIFDKMSEKYKYGMASSLELTNSSTELISAQSSYVQALLEVVTAQIDLENLLNKQK